MTSAQMTFFLFEIVSTIPTEPASQSSAVDFSLLFIKMISALIVAIVLAILVLKYALPRLTLSKRFQENRDIKIISKFSLGAKRDLYLVKIKEKSILLGVTDQSIGKIADINNEADEK